MIALDVSCHLLLISVNESLLDLQDYFRGISWDIGVHKQLRNLVRHLILQLSFLRLTPLISSDKNPTT